MTEMEKRFNYLSLNMSQKEQMYKVARALASVQRLDILKLLSKHCILNVGEVSRALDLPVSSVSHHIAILEEAQLISCERQPSLGGIVKMCSRAKDEVTFLLGEKEQAHPRHFMQQLPIGAYSHAANIQIPCGLASVSAPIGAYNNPRSFFLSERLQAEVLWFRGGYLEYDFAMLSADKIKINWLEVSFEACSQAPVTSQGWQSDLELSVNQVPLGRHAVGCDSLGRRGSLNPDWWPDVMTQSGKLLTWRVDQDGCYINKEKASSASIPDLQLLARDRITLRIAAPVASQPGINLFGLRFGDHKQSLVLEIGYSLID